MSEAASPKKRASAAKAKKAPSHPTYAQMVKMAISTLKEKGGSSKAAILKYILSNYKVGDNIKQINAHLRMAINRGVKSGALKQVKGHGASGSFRLGEKAAKKPRKPAAPKKKAAPKKAATPKKPAAKPKKTTPKKKKSPAKKPKAEAPPKKAKKSPAKKPKPAPKKSPAKKAAKKSPKKKAAKA